MCSYNHLMVEGSIEQLCASREVGTSYVVKQKIVSVDLILKIHEQTA
jgi:hypothetical protein